jgi:hypothetical protein
VKHFGMIAREYRTIKTAPAARSIKRNMPVIMPESLRLKIAGLGNAVL